MTRHSKLLRAVAVCSPVALLLGTLPAHAQEPAPAPAAPTPAAPAPLPPPTEPAPVEALPAAPEPQPVPPAATGAVGDANLAPVQPEAGTTPEIPPQPAAAPSDEAPMGAPTAPAEDAKTVFEKSIDYSVWGRVHGLANNGDKLDDVSAAGLFELHVFGQVHENIKFTFNLTTGFNPELTRGVTLLDGIIQFELHDLFNVWAGRMLVPSDRQNFSGVWFSAPWFYPGFYPNGLVVAPRQGPWGRNDGATIWGQVGGGLFKYYAGAFDLHDGSQSPLYSGRLNLSLLNPEPGYYHSSTYYGKDILAIGVSGQAKNDGSVGVAPPPAMPGDEPGAAPTGDYYGFSADILFEKDLGSSGVLDLEAAYYYFDGEYEAVEQGWFALASYLLPAGTGPGRLQPLVRVSQAVPTADDADPSTMIEGQLGYVIDAYSARLALGYQHGELDDAKYNSLYLGAQFMK